MLSCRAFKVRSSTEALISPNCKLLPSITTSPLPDISVKPGILISPEKLTFLLVLRAKLLSTSSLKSSPSINISPLIFIGVSIDPPSVMVIVKLPPVTPSTEKRSVSKIYPPS